MVLGGGPVAGCSALLNVEDFSQADGGGTADGSSGGHDGTVDADAAPSEGGGDTTIADTSADVLPDTTVVDVGAMDVTVSDVVQDVVAVDVSDAIADIAAEAPPESGSEAGAGCVIAGVSYATSQFNPANACQICTPAASASAWSNVPSGTTCGSAACSGSALTNGATCNGTGTCVAGSSGACPGGFLCASATACKTACTSVADCVSPNQCMNPGASGTCLPGAASGTPCSTGSQCANGLCVNNFCCSTACNGTCQACAASLTGTINGTCANMNMGSPAPVGQCTAAPPCGNTGNCAFGGVCEEKASGTVCGGAAACTGSTLTTASTCTGSGTCASGTTGACAGGFVCASTTACLTSCGSDPDCASASNYCLNPGSTGTCVAKSGQGSPCTATDQCTSGLSCASGFCCNSACTSTCMACSAALTGGTNGTCANVSPGTAAPAGQCTAAAMSTCGNNGNCNGSGACADYASGSVCLAAACSSSTNMLTTASTCNGTGTCNAGTTAACAGGFICASGTACKTACSSNTDCASSGNVCQNPGASGTCVAGSSLYALSFDSSGNGKVSVATNAALNPPSAITVEGWMAQAAPSAPVGTYWSWGVGVDCPYGNVGGSGYFLGYEWNNWAWPSFQVVEYPSGGQIAQLGCEATGPTQVTGLHHLAGTFNGATGLLAVWVDGALGCTAQATGSAPYTLHYTVAGTITPGVGQATFGVTATASSNLLPFQGTLDDVRISNTVLYTTTFTPVRHPTASSSTVGLWLTTEGSGMTTADTSGKGDTGTLSSSGVTWVTQP